MFDDEIKHCNWLSDLLKDIIFSGGNIPLELKGTSYQKAEACKSDFSEIEKKMKDDIERVELIDPPIT